LSLFVNQITMVKRNYSVILGGVPFEIGSIDSTITTTLKGVKDVVIAKIPAVKKVEFFDLFYEEDGKDVALDDKGWRPISILPQEQINLIPFHLRVVTDEAKDHHARMLRAFVHPATVPEFLEKEEDDNILRYGSWNLNHFNNKYGGSILAVMAELMYHYDIIFLIEISATAPLEDLVRLLRPPYRSSGKFAMSAREAERHTGFYGTVIYDASRVCLPNTYALWEYLFVRPPYTTGVQFRSWYFTSTEVHLASGQEGKSQRQKEIAALATVVDEILVQLTTSVNCIVSGDFNADSRETSIAPIFALIKDPKKKPYEALIKENTMNSMKNIVANDNILVPTDLEARFVGAYVHRVSPEDFEDLPRGLALITQDTKNAALQALFTDHALVGAAFDATGVTKRKKDKIPIWKKITGSALPKKK